MKRLQERLKIVDAMVTGIVQVIEEHRAVSGDEAAESLAFEFLTAYVGSLVYSSLQAGRRNASSDKDYDTAVADYKVIKMSIQNSIEDAFRLAFNQFDPNLTPEYACEITLLTATPSAKETH